MKTNNYTYAKDLIPITNKLHKAFIKHKNLNPKDYVLDAKSALDFYSLTRGSSNKQTININEKNKKEVVLKYLQEVGYPLEEVTILKRQKKEIMNESINVTTTDKYGTIKKVNIVSREKLFINIDLYDDITPDERNRAINKLRKEIDFKKLNKLVRLMISKKRHVSNEAYNYIDEYNRGTPRVRDDKRSDLIKQVQKIIKDEWNVQMGGIAVEEFCDIPRASFDLDVFSPKYKLDWIVSKLRERYDVIDGRLNKKPEEKEFSKYSTINKKHEKSTITIIKDNENNTSLKFKDFKIDINHMMTKELISKLRKKNLIEETDSGFFLCPEALIASKLNSVFNNFDSRKPHTLKNNKLGNIKYSERIVKDIFDIDNLTICNLIDKNKIYSALKILYEAGYDKLDLTKLSNLKHIINNDLPFRNDYLKIRKRNAIDNIPFLFDDKNITEYCEYLIKKENSKKKQKTLKINTRGY